MGTSCHCEFSLPYNPANAKEAARLKKLFIVASEAFAGMGAYYSRPYGIWSKLQLNKDAQSTITLRKLKEMFDPNNVMNPGKLCV
jgi:FAD/FMN-containing dehydrogenase